MGGDRVLLAIILAGGMVTVVPVVGVLVAWYLGHLSETTMLSFMIGFLAVFLLGGSGAGSRRRR